MHLTAQETKLITGLRRREQRWPRDRWILLCGGVVMLVAYGCILGWLVSQLQSENVLATPAATTLIVAVFWPKCLFGLCLGAYLVGLAIRDWHGNAHRMLLLRLLDAQQKDSSRDENAG